MLMVKAAQGGKELLNQIESASTHFVMQICARQITAVELTLRVGFQESFPFLGINLGLGLPFQALPP